MDFALPKNEGIVGTMTGNSWLGNACHTGLETFTLEQEYQLFLPAAESDCSKPAGETNWNRLPKRLEETCSLKRKICVLNVKC